MTREKIAEILVRRKYKNITLPDKFWNLPAYKKDYQHQIRLAAKFFRVYRAEAIYNVVEREKWCFSLATKNIADLIQIENNKMELLERQKTELFINKSNITTGNNIRINKKEDFREE